MTRDLASPLAATFGTSVSGPGDRRKKKRNKKRIIGGGGNCLKRGKAGGKGCKKFRSRVSKHGYGGY
tara:strand:- start:592 stop:792 length:201 start_codon:yes stop_codon:yes gene_type:complete